MARAVIQRLFGDYDLSTTNHSIEALAAASVYIGCRDQQLPYNIDRLATLSTADRWAIADAYGYICDQLDLGFLPPDPRKYIRTLLSDVDAPIDIEAIAKQLLTHDLTTGNASGKRPIALAAAAILVASRVAGTTYQTLSQRAVAEAANVQRSSIRTHQERFREYHTSETVDLQGNTSPSGSAEAPPSTSEQRE